MAGKKMGRPLTQIDKDIFENICGIQCTLSEIASVFRCSEDTVERWCKREYGERFADVHKRYAERGKMSLRRMQWKLAEKSPAMAIFLGKNLLGQRDRPEPQGFDPSKWNIPQGEGAVPNGNTRAEAEITDA